jgi:hypothetical protein
MLMPRIGSATLACAASLALLAHHARADTTASRLPVPDVRPLLVAAIDAPDGRAHGVLTGPLADALAERFKASSPLHVDVSTERRYTQDGCRRLKVSFWQEGVLLPGAATPRRQTVDFRLNYCRNGHPPRSLS